MRMSGSIQRKTPTNHSSTQYLYGQPSRRFPGSLSKSESETNPNNQQQGSLQNSPRVSLLDYDFHANSHGKDARTSLDSPHISNSVRTQFRYGQARRNSVHGLGKQIETSLRKDMESAFNADFSDIRIQEGNQASSLGALAYTQDSNIHFARGKYNPSSTKGRRLLGHELAHVVQQRMGRVSSKNGINTDPSLEAEASKLGAKAATGESIHKTELGAQPESPQDVSTDAIQLCKWCKNNSCDDSNNCVFGYSEYDQPTDEDIDLDDTDYQGPNEEKLQRQREKAQKRKNEVNANKEKGSNVDTSSDIFKFGQHMQNTSLYSRNFLNQGYQQKNPNKISNVVNNFQNQQNVDLTGFKPYEVFQSMRSATELPKNVNVQTDFKLNLGTNKQRKGGVKYPQQRLNQSTIPMPIKGDAYDALQKAPENKLTKETLQPLWSLEQHRDPSSSNVNYIKNQRRLSKKITKKQQFDPNSNLSVMTMKDATTGNTDLEKLKTQNIANNIIDLKGDNDTWLAKSTGGQDIKANQHYQDMWNSYQNPNDKDLQVKAIQSQFRIDRESEDLSGIATPTPEEIKKGLQNPPDKSRTPTVNNLKRRNKVKNLEKKKPKKKRKLNNNNSNK